MLSPSVQTRLDAASARFDEAFEKWDNAGLEHLRIKKAYFAVNARLCDIIDHPPFDTYHKSFYCPYTKTTCFQNHGTTCETSEYICDKTRNHKMKIDQARADLQVAKQEVEIAALHLAIAEKEFFLVVQERETVNKQAHNPAICAQWEREDAEEARKVEELRKASDPEEQRKAKKQRTAERKKAKERERANRRWQAEQRKKWKHFRDPWGVESESEDEADGDAQSDSPDSESESETDSEDETDTDSDTARDADPLDDGGSALAEEFEATALQSFAEKAKDWNNACATAFQDKSKMRSFPQPPHEVCDNRGCKIQARSRALKACPCDIRKVFEGRTTLKTDRLQYHPDKFAGVAEDVREKIQQAAKEVFVVVDDLHKMAMDEAAKSNETL